MVYLRLLQYRVRSLYEYNSLQSKFKRIEKIFPPSHIRLISRRDDDFQGSPDNSFAPKRVFFASARFFQSFNQGLFRNNRRSVHHADNTVEALSRNGNGVPSNSVIWPGAEISSTSFSSNLNSVTPNFLGNDLSSLRSFSVSTPAHVYDRTHLSLRSADLHETMDRIIHRSRHSPISQFVLDAYEGSSDGNRSRAVSAVDNLSCSEFKLASVDELDLQIVNTMNQVQSFASPGAQSSTSSLHPIGLGIINSQETGDEFRTCIPEPSSVSVASVPSHTIHRTTSSRKVDGGNKENEASSRPVSSGRRNDAGVRLNSRYHLQTTKHSLRRSIDNQSALDNIGKRDYVTSDVLSYQQDTDRRFGSDATTKTTPNPNGTHSTFRIKSPQNSSPKHWRNLFSKKVTSYSLLSVEIPSKTLPECELLLSKMSVATERIHSSNRSKDVPALRCTIDQGVGNVIAPTSFMITLAPVTLHPHVTAGYQTRLKLTLENGALSTFNHIYNMLRRDWNLDTPTDLTRSPNPVRIAASPAVRDAGLELAPWA